MGRSSEGLSGRAPPKHCPRCLSLASYPCLPKPGPPLQPLSSSSFPLIHLKIYLGKDCTSMVTSHLIVSRQLARLTLHSHLFVSSPATNHQSLVTKSGLIYPLYFHAITKCKFRNSFVLIFIRN